MITLGLSTHRPEMVPLTGELMARHEAVFLEEPPADGFHEMLGGEITVKDYLAALDLEYPTFSRNMCQLLKKLNAKGKRIYQVEPFLEALMAIHDFFADGHGPEELGKNTLAYPVYLAEKRATGALLEYYRTVVGGTFEQTLESVLRFARLDAARFRLRDSLRAQGLASLVHRHSSAYIEAGMMHYAIWGLLRRNLPDPQDLKVKFLDEMLLSKTGLKGRLYAPGDLLTLHYIFHPKSADNRRKNLLGARALVYAKLIAKTEMAADDSSMPHLTDEHTCIKMVSTLSAADCRKLFPEIRRSSSLEARAVVSRYLEQGHSV
jgi:hypothetical protein